MGVTYRWKGQRNPGTSGFHEFFGPPNGLPARDLSDADVDGFNDVQLEKLHSATGQRLYEPAGTPKRKGPKAQTAAADKQTEDDSA